VVVAIGSRVTDERVIGDVMWMRVQSNVLERGRRNVWRKVMDALACVI